MRVRPLPWKSVGSKLYPDDCKAATPVGEYTAFDLHGEPTALLLRVLAPDTEIVRLGSFDTIDEAKEACREHYVGTVHGMVEPPTAPTWTLPTEECPTPTEKGTYFVRIAGDSESDEGQVLYDYPDYSTTGHWSLDAEIEHDTDGKSNGVWSLAFEEAEDVIGWSGPFRPPSWA